MMSLHPSNLLINCGFRTFPCGAPGPGLISAAILDKSREHDIIGMTNRPRINNQQGIALDVPDRGDAQNLKIHSAFELCTKEENYLMYIIKEVLDIL